MTTPRSRGLLSFRRSVARIAKDRAEEEDDDGWVHGGKYVPATASAGRHPQRPSSTPDAAHGGAGSHGPASGRGGTQQQQQQQQQQTSPYAMPSPAPLDTPLPQESMGAPSTGPSSTHAPAGASTGATPQAAAGASNPTPPTVQLRRLLEPTPAHARTPQSMTNDLIATPDHAGGQQQRVLAPTTPMGHFLQRSGVPHQASHAIGDAATQLYDNLFSLLVAAWNAAAGGWERLVAVHVPRDLVPDVVETLGELVADVLRTAWRVVRFLAPYLLWAVQTLLALALTIGGTVVWGMVFLAKGSKAEADRSGAGEVQSSAMKSLKESVRNSPFFRRGGRTLPFTGFTDGMAPPPGHSVGRQAVQAAAAASTSTTVHPPSSTRSTPPVSAMRPVRPTPRATHPAAGGQKTPATARRVLFSETERGEVATEHFHFDKHLPASARKVDPRTMESNGLGSVAQRRHSAPQANGAAQSNGAAQRNGMSRKVPAASPAVASGTASASSTPENTILRPSKYYDSPADSSEKIPQKKPAEPFQPKPASASATQPQGASASKAAAKKEEEVQNEEERQKQQYIERYGLLPTITPLSKRYGRMKRQQQQQQGKQPLAIGHGPAAGASKNDPTAGANRNIGANPKRKRRGDLLGAAARLGRTRRARLGAAGPSALPSVLLRRATPHKRRRDDAGLAAADAWVWRAMNKDPDHGKENRENDVASEATAAKRGKFASSSSSSSNSDAVGTPPKHDPTPTTLPSVMTPPKTPGPSKFSTLGSATPAPKKWSTADAASTATPGKPTLPFSFGDDSVGGDASNDAGGGAAFSFGAKTNDGASAAATGGSAGGAGFSFGTAAPATASDKKGAPAASSTPGFSFGTAGTAASTKKKDATTAPASGAAGFSFNASTTAASVPAAVEKATPAPASGGAGFSFNASATATSAPATSDKKEAASTPAFSFGSNANTTTASTGAAPSSAAPAPFSFGSTATSTDTSKAPAPAAAAATPGFAFGSSQPAPTPAATTPAVSFGQPTPAPPASASSGATFSFGTGAGGAPAAATPATASAPFSFGSSSQPTPAAQPKEAAPAGAAFSFGTQPAPAAGATQPSTFAFGAGATAAPAAPNFAGLGATPASSGFSLGGSGASGGGASARRRAAKASGRRR